MFSTCYLPKVALFQGSIVSLMEARRHQDSNYGHRRSALIILRVKWVICGCCVEGLTGGKEKGGGGEEEKGGGEVVSSCHHPVVRHPIIPPTSREWRRGHSRRILMGCVTLRFLPIQKKCSLTLWAINR